MTRSVLAHAGSWILDGQAGMSKQGDSPRLRILAAIAGARSAEQSTFMNGDVCASRHVSLL